MTVNRARYAVGRSRESYAVSVAAGQAALKVQQSVSSLTLFMTLPFGARRLVATARAFGLPFALTLAPGRVYGLNLGMVRQSIFSILLRVWSAVAVLAVMPLAASAEDGEPAEPCTLEPGPEGVVARIQDGETIVLADGSIVRLIGALAPRARDASAVEGQWAPEIEATKALSDLILGKKVKLAFGGRRTDRYGRLLAHVFLARASGDEWVQGALLRAGEARAYGLPESFACARELLAHEALARRSRQGLWSNGVYATMPAARPDALMKARGKYERVIGSVVSVGRTKSAVYLNFSNDWKTDFTARIGKSVLASNPEFDKTLDALKGKTIIVRGWIERRNGPEIDIADPSEIEVLDGDSEPATITSGTPPSDRAPAKAEGNATINEGAPPKDLCPAPPEGAEPGGLNL